MFYDIIRQFLNDKEYDKDPTQSLCNGISGKIIKALHKNHRNLLRYPPAFHSLDKEDSNSFWPIQK